MNVDDSDTKAMAIFDEDTKAMAVFDEDTKPMTAAEPPGPIYGVFNLFSLALGLILLATLGFQPGIKPFRPATGNVRPAAPVTPSEGATLAISFGTITGQTRATALAWDSRGVVLAIGGDQGGLLLWDCAANRQLRGKLDAPGEVISLGFRGSAPATAPANLPQERKPGHQSVNAAGPAQSANPLAGQTLTSLHGNYRKGGFSSCRLLVWNLASARPVRQKDLEGRQIFLAAFSASGEIAAAVSNYGIEALQLDKFEPVRRNFFGTRPISLALPDRGQIAAVGDNRGTVFLVDMQGARPSRKSQLYPYPAEAIVAASVDASVIAIGFNSELRAGSLGPRPVRIWRNWKDSPQPPKDFVLPPGKVLSLQILDNFLIAHCLSFEKQGTDRVRRPVLVAWDLTSGKELKKIALPADTFAALVAPTGRRAAIIRPGGQIEILKLPMDQPKGIR